MTTISTPRRRNVDCPSPTNGKIIAFNYTGANRNDYFKLVDWDTCAYTGDVAPWVLIQLPRMNLRLHADLPADGVGVIDISDGAALSTNGLDAWGTIQIGGEQLTYTAKTATTITLTARGVNGTTAAAHLADDPVYILCDNQATDAYPLDRVTWWRPPGANAPKNFAVYLSNMLTLPRMPSHDDEDPSSNYRVDYNWAYGVENHASNTWTWNLAGFNVRPSWLLMEISAMQTGPARPRLNTISAYLDTACWDDAEWLPVNTDIGAAYTHLLTQIGIPSGCIHDYTTNHDNFKLITGEKPAWPVLVDMADYTNTMVKVNLLSHIYLYDNSMWQTAYTGPGSLTNPIATYDRTTAKNVKLIQERPGPVGQVKLTWLNTEGEEAGTITYPNPADPSGLVQTLKPAIHASAAYALAAFQRRYLVLKHPNTIGVELATGNPALRTGVAYGIAWNFHDGSNAAKVGYCQSIDHVLENIHLDHRPPSHRLPQRQLLGPWRPTHDHHPFAHPRRRKPGHRHRPAALRRQRQLPHHQRHESEDRRLQLPPKRLSPAPPLAAPSPGPAPSAAAFGSTTTASPGPSASHYLPIVSLQLGATAISALWDPVAAQFRLFAGYVSNSINRSYPVVVGVANNFASTNTWFHVGLAAKIAAAAGFVSLYIDGQQVLNWTGDTRVYASNSALALTTISGVYLLGGPYHLIGGHQHRLLERLRLRRRRLHRRQHG